MFTTFVSTPPQGSPPDPPETNRATTTPRPKRSQVSRACDWCRAHRSKCDSNYPCRNCEIRGSQCTNKGTAEVRSLPHAVREIEQLRLRIKELQEQLKNQEQLTNQERLKNQEHFVQSTCLPSPATSSTESTASAIAALDPLKENGGNRKHWGGIHTSTAQSQQTQYYGPPSQLYFIGQISSYLGTILQQPHSDHHIHPNSASKSFASPTSPHRVGAGQNQIMSSLPLSENNNNLTRNQEDYFLGLFWQSYHCTLPILDEAEFREHYESLWSETAPTAFRQPSALVDIVLAICMQYGIAFIPRNNASASTQSKVDVDGNDAAIAGRWFYRRCQKIIRHELESPSITTLQCHLLSVIYLCNASFQNMAHNTLALATRIAQNLGLHLEPSEEMPRPQRELRKRLWWNLYAIEIKTCMKLGRSWSINLSQVTCMLPADDLELALLSSSTFTSASGQDITWLTYSSHLVKLVLAAQTIYIAYYEKYSEIQDSNEEKIGPYYKTHSLETCAEVLLSKMQYLQDWMQNVPSTLKTKRRGTGEPYSTDRSPLDIEAFAPVWLQRQRLILELLYHNLAMNLHRPFIRFPPSFNSCTPLAERNAILCVNHAIAITHIIYQLLSETDILGGWYEAFQWQWNASLSMIGFILAYPISSSTPSARKTLSCAIRAFEAFGDNFAMAASAGNVTRDLAAKADLLIDRFRTNLTTPELAFPGIGDGSVGQTCSDPELRSNQDSGYRGDALAGSIDMAFSIDSLNGFESLDNNLANMWNLGQDPTFQLFSSWPANN